MRLCNYFYKEHRDKRKAYRKSLYKKYTHLGLHHNKHGNFLKYALRAQEIFDKNKLTENEIYKPLKKHWRKIQARLSK